ncbi:MAG TPA: hypothetical protein VMU50_12610 [Polyangia bacterium]|nr:hypothetical protein [Polyangia bacterium]
MLPPRAALALPGAPRVIYVRDGQARIAAQEQSCALAENSAWHGGAGCEATAGPGGATLLRWELAATGVAAAGPNLRHEADVALDARQRYLLRCDRVDFPPGGVAYTHTHQGPGVRCLLRGSLEVRVHGGAQLVQPGESWFEAGPDPVLALASPAAPTSFVRCMVLPADLRGRPSIRYVLDEDRDKPKTQQYQVFIDDPIVLPRAD